MTEDQPGSEHETGPLRRRMSCTVGCTAAAVAFAAFGAAPAWAAPVPDVRPGPPVGTPAPQNASTSASSPYAAGGSRTPSPPVADTGGLDDAAPGEPLEETRSAEYFAVSSEPLPEGLLGDLQDIEGVETAETVDAARVRIDGTATSVLGVNPSTFRAYAPEPSAEADEIWQGIAEGHVALSHDLGEERGLELGAEVRVEGGREDVTKQVWTHATSGIGGIDAVVSREVTSELGFPEGNAVVISAPDADLWELHDRLEDLFGPEVGLQMVAEDPGPPEGSGAAASGSVVEEMLSAAKSQLGVPYVWGGDHPDTGFDCSGLVQWAFAQAGVRVPRVTHDQWNAGERVEYADARRGDLLFWRNDPTAPDYISHVAVYLGDGQMLEAPRSGLNVRVTDVRFNNFAGLVRVHVPD